MRFLASVGPSADAELYLRLFRSRAPERFATIAVEADAIAQAADSVAVDLRFLQTLGLTPVVVLGLDDDAGSRAQRTALHALLDDLGVATAALDGDVSGTAVRAATAAGRIPLLVARTGADGTPLDMLAGLLSGLRTHKLIVLGSQGGLSAGSRRLSVVNLTTEHATLSAAPELSTRDRRVLELCRALVLERVAEPLLVSVTSPLNLLRELFTVKGAGTLLRRGARIVRHRAYESVDLARLRALLTSSFGKPPNEQLFGRPLADCYVEEHYRGAALIMATELGSYLSKFAVTREAQGEGLGQDLLDQLVADHPALFWRARADNPVRAWYERICQARYATAHWTVYCRGLPPDRMAAAITFALAQPNDF